MKGLTPRCVGEAKLARQTADLPSWPSPSLVGTDSMRNGFASVSVTAGGDEDLLKSSASSEQLRTFGFWFGLGRVGGVGVASAQAARELQRTNAEKIVVRGGTCGVHIRRGMFCEDGSRLDEIPHLHDGLPVITGMICSRAIFYLKRAETRVGGMDSLLEELKLALESAVQGMSEEQMKWHPPEKWCCGGSVGASVSNLYRNGERIRAVARSG